MADEENNRYYAEGSITDAGERAPVREPEGWLDPGMYAPVAIGEAERWLDASSHLPAGVRKEEMSLDPKDYHVRSARGHLPFIGGVNSLSDTPYVLGYNFMQRHKKGVTPMRLKLKSEKGDTVMNKTKKDGSVRTNREGETKTKVISPGDWFEFEIEPTVSVEGKNTIISRKVLRSGIRGTVKERWSHDDYTITITGLLINKNRLLKTSQFAFGVEDLQTYPNIDLPWGKRFQYPSDDVRKLITYFNSRELIQVDHSTLNNMGIYYFIIESLKFPETEGLEYQKFEIKAISEPDIFETETPGADSGKKTVSEDA